MFLLLYVMFCVFIVFIWMYCLSYYLIKTATAVRDFRFVQNNLDEGMLSLLVHVKYMGQLERLNASVVLGRW